MSLKIGCFGAVMWYRFARERALRFAAGTGTTSMEALSAHAANRLARAGGPSMNALATPANGACMHRGGVASSVGASVLRARCTANTSAAAYAQTRATTRRSQAIR